VLRLALLGKMQEQKALTTEERLVKPAAVKIARIMRGDVAANKLIVFFIYFIFLSNNTIKWRIQELSVDILQ